MPCVLARRLRTFEGRQAKAFALFVFGLFAFLAHVSRLLARSERMLARTAGRPGGPVPLLFGWTLPRLHPIFESVRGRVLLDLFGFPLGGGGRLLALLAAAGFAARRSSGGISDGCPHVEGRQALLSLGGGRILAFARAGTLVVLPLTESAALLDRRPESLGVLVRETALAAIRQVTDEREPTRLLQATNRLVQRMDRVVGQRWRKCGPPEFLKDRVDEAE